jgi:hypothetical protein
MVNPEKQQRSFSRGQLASQYFLMAMNMQLIRFREG